MLSLRRSSTADCPFCGTESLIESVPSPEWHRRDRRPIPRYECPTCGEMRLDAEPDGMTIEHVLASHLDRATPAELAFLSRTNQRWIDEVVYEAWMTRRLLEAYEASRAVLSSFGLGSAEVISSAGGIDHADVMVLVGSRDTRWTVRVYGPKTAEIEVRSELFWIGRLQSEIDAHVPRPLPGGNGSQIQTAHIAADDRFCTAYAWLPGRRLAEVAEDLPAETVSRIGLALAEMHVCGTEPDVPDWFGRQTHAVSTTTGAEGLPGDDPLISRLRASAGCFGLIHKELGHHNVLVDQDEGISFIDFTTLGWGYFVHDIGTVARGLPRSMWDDFLSGYSSARPLTATELEWIDRRLP